MYSKSRATIVQTSDKGCCFTKNYISSILKLIFECQSPSLCLREVFDFTSFRLSFKGVPQGAMVNKGVDLLRYNKKSLRFDRVNRKYRAVGMWNLSRLPTHKIA